MQKHELRDHFKALRAATATPERIEALTKTSLTFGASFHQYAVVGAYYPIQTEASPLPLLQHLAQQNIQTALPRVAAPDKPLHFHAWQPGDALQPGYRHIPEPSQENPQIIPAALLVPLLAFDAKGHRLGYGAGFYDRTIQFLRSKNQRFIAVGLAYDTQETDRLPADRHDQKLDAVITESGFRWLGVD
ncbi:5-formyltetrahydrofolate cyclo-ligase [bacterium]|nr:5-formyltetrahydrofolate cyclo-ligase [bacterium]